MLVGGGIPDSSEDVGEVFGRFDTIRDAGSDERVETSEVSPCAWMAEEEIVVARQRDDTQSCFGGIVVNWDSSVSEKELETSALVDGVRERFAQRAFGERLGLLRFGPCEELVDDGLTRSLAQREMSG